MNYGYLFQRHMGKYVWNYHFPSGLFVVVSWETMHCTINCSLLLCVNNLKCRTLAKPKGKKEDIEKIWRKG